MEGLCDLALQLLPGRRRCSVVTAFTLDLRPGTTLGVVTGPRRQGRTRLLRALVRAAGASTSRARRQPRQTPYAASPSRTRTTPAPPQATPR